MRIKAEFTRRQNIPPEPENCLGKNDKEEAHGAYFFRHNETQFFKRRKQRKYKQKSVGEKALDKKQAM